MDKVACSPKPGIFHREAKATYPAKHVLRIIQVMGGNEQQKIVLKLLLKIIKLERLVQFRGFVYILLFCCSFLEDLYLFGVFARAVIGLCYTLGIYICAAYNIRYIN